MGYKTKTQEEQKKDLQILDRVKWRQDVYFDLLQLRNKLVGIDTYDKVNEADRTFSERRAAMLYAERAVVGVCDKKHLLDIHEYLFQDIYYFAGKLRDVPMEIDSVTRFEGPKALPVKLDNMFERLKKEGNLQNLTKETFIDRTANYLTDLNVLHPFREGNGRTKRIFFTELAKQAGYDLDWSKCSKNEWKMADECAFDSNRDNQRDVSYLKHLLDRAVTPLNASSSHNNDAWKDFMRSAKTEPEKAQDKAKVKQNFME